MDNAPYDYITQANASCLASLKTFKHRTFNGEDVLGIAKTYNQYTKYHSLEDAILIQNQESQFSIKENLHKLHLLFAQSPHVAQRTMRHIASPYKKAACKGLVIFPLDGAKDNSNIDFGLWTSIKSSQLECLDIHVARIARELGFYNVKPMTGKQVENSVAPYAK